MHVVLEAEVVGHVTRRCPIIMRVGSSSGY